MLLRSSETQPLFIDLSSIDRNQSFRQSPSRICSRGCCCCVEGPCIWSRASHACCRACLPVVEPVDCVALRSGASNTLSLQMLQGLLLQEGANPLTNLRYRSSLLPGQTDRKALALLGAVAHWDSRSACGRPWSKPLLRLWSRAGTPMRSSVQQGQESNDLLQGLLPLLL